MASLFARAGLPGEDGLGQSTPKKRSLTLGVNGHSRGRDIYISSTGRNSTTPGVYGVVV
jgi:hypothetical protein